MKTIECPKCCGIGRLPDQRDVGAQMRKIRLDAGLSIHDVAKMIGFTPPYISDLELGRRNWTADTKARFIVACRKGKLK